MKVLPKFHGSRGRLEAPLRALLAWCLNPDAPQEGAIAQAFSASEDGAQVVAELGRLPYACPLTAGRAIRMLSALYADGFAAFG